MFCQKPVPDMRIPSSLQNQLVHFCWFILKQLPPGGLGRELGQFSGDLNKSLSELYVCHEAASSFSLAHMKTQNRKKRVEKENQGCKSFSSNYSLDRNSGRLVWAKKVNVSLMVIPVSFQIEKRKLKAACLHKEKNVAPLWNSVGVSNWCQCI